MCPRLASSTGRLPTTSPRPPVLLQGATCKSRNETRGDKCRPRLALRDWQRAPSAHLGRHKHDVEGLRGLLRRLPSRGGGGGRRDNTAQRRRGSVSVVPRQHACRAVDAPAGGASGHWPRGSGARSRLHSRCARGGLDTGAREVSERPWALHANECATARFESCRTTCTLATRTGPLRLCRRRYVIPPAVSVDQLPRPAGTVFFSASSRLAL